MRISGSPPQKRRRYAEVVGFVPSEPAAGSLVKEPEDVPAKSSHTATTDITVPESISKAHGGPAAGSSSSGSSSRFDPAVFTALIEEKLPSDTLKQLEDASNGDMERAINM